VRGRSGADPDDPVLEERALHQDGGVRVRERGDRARREARRGLHLGSAGDLQRLSGARPADLVSRS